MRKLLKWVFRIFLLLVVLIVAALIFRNQIAKFIIEWELRDYTGTEVKIGKVEIGIMSSFLKIENLQLKNTREFGGSTFMDVPEIYIEYDRPALMSGKFHAITGRLNVSEMNIIKNQAGQTNLPAAVAHIQKTLHRKHRKLPDFNAIDSLTMTLGKGRYYDLKTPANNFELNFLLQNETVKNVKSGRDLNGIILLAVTRNILATAATRGGSLNSLVHDSQETIDRTKRFLDLVIPPKKPKQKAATSETLRK